MITRVGHIIGYVLIVLGVSELTPIMVALSFGEDHLILPFFICSMLTIFIGTGFYFAFRDDPEKPNRYNIITFLVLVWFIVPIFASIPFMVSGELTQFSDAYFEATSALTTTGSSMFANPGLVPKAVLFWRSFLQWQGGLYIFVLATAIVPLSTIGGSELYRSALPHGEGEGFVARIRSALFPLALVYGGFSFACMILLSLSGMTLFDAICTAMATLSSGGFTNHANSGVNSFGNMTEFILIPFMIIAATNLTYHWSFATSGRWRGYQNDREIKYFLTIAALASLIIFMAMGNAMEQSLFKRIGSSVFTAVSALSTTGFLPDGAGVMPLGVVITCIIMVFIGGSMGSSAGGFKIMRFKVLFRQADGEISRLAHPHGIVPMRVNDMNVTEPILMSIWTLLFLYLSSVAFFSIVYSMFGYDLGVSIGLTVANLFSAGSMTNLITQDFISYSVMPYAAKWVTSAVMILGRLEIVAFLIFLSPSFRRI